MNIKIFYDNVNFRLQESIKIRKLLEKVIKSENKSTDDLVFIFTNDEKIREINKEFIKHNWFTDVIAFDYCENKNIRGEIYISVDTVKLNARNYKVSLKSEILRVMIHGILHLCGYEDETKRKKLIMKDKEDLWIKKYYTK